MEITVRRARVEDKARVLQVEATATPNLRYLSVMFEHWVHDQVGELSVAELDGILVGVAKFTILPDGSAWLEALRVSTEAQGKGVGKRFYQRFFELARERQVSTMRMYTGIRNVASKGLAERFGFHLAATYHGSGCSVELAPSKQAIDGFRVIDPAKAQALLLPLGEQWDGFMVMNRTFYAVTPELCAAWAKAGQVYHDAESNSLLVLGARFQADQTLHIACMSGDLKKCLTFAEQKARELVVPKLTCLFSPKATAISQTLLQHGFQADPSDYIVMEVAI
ncbi:MAG TPA: hypothetical protein DDZ53_08515 [Firmicutes bacterium]|nr:hypothetical protein [Bacillota bacterium]